MKRIALFTVVLLGLVIGAASPADAAWSFWARMSGASEVPAASGDPDATGIALLSLKRGGKLCYVLHVKNVDGTINAAHLHLGAVGQDGPVVAPLAAPVGGNVAACTRLGRSLARSLARHPSWYYVNVHSTTYPDGALRGQLY
jgi:hypothetical protein